VLFSSIEPLVVRSCISKNNIDDLAKVVCLLYKTKGSQKAEKKEAFRECKLHREKCKTN
jgi:hypothetical protein